MKLRFKALSLVASLVAVSTLQATPILVDQTFSPAEWTLGSGVSLEIPKAQTFTAGKAGQLVFASVAIFQNFSCSTCLLDFEIRRTANGAPSDSPADVLAHIRLNSSSLPNYPSGSGGGWGSAVPDLDSFFLFDLRAFDIFVRPGDQLAMVFSAPTMLTDDTIAGLLGCWSGFCGTDGGDPYTGGEHWFKNANAGFPNWSPTAIASIEQGRFDDIAFQTFVRVGKLPEPSTLALLYVGLAGLAFTRRRKQ